MAHDGRGNGQVIVIDADRARAAELSDRLRLLNFEPVLADKVQDGNLQGSRGIALFLGKLSDSKHLRLVHSVAKKNPDLPVLVNDKSVLRGEVGKSLGSRPIWKVSTPLRHSRLSHLLRRAQRYDGIERRHKLSGNSPSIRHVRQLIEQVADHDTNVMITGESGTGKELVAQTIHDLSERRGGPFVPINCGAIPEELLESELFGHVKGAFTGAISDRAGRFELAAGGTLFLDEIGDMSLDMQVKLLRVIQEKKFDRIGSNQTIDCNVRIVAATHRCLEKAVRAGEFREDLYYRISVFPIDMPPLYKRASDLPQLLEELFLSHSRESSTRGLRMSEEALTALANYKWPGNVRELSNLVERLAILFPKGTIGLNDLPEKYRDPKNQRAGDTGLLCGAIEQDIPNLTQKSMKLYLQDVEINLIQQALERSDGVVAKAARLLNMRRTTLVEKMARYQLAD